MAEEQRDLRQKAVTGSYRFSRRAKHHQEWETPPEFYVDWLANRQPAFALVRQWCGAGEQDRWQENQALRTEIERLRTLVEGAISTFRSHGHPHLSKRLETEYWGEQYEVRAQAQQQKREARGLPADG